MTRPVVSWTIGEYSTTRPMAQYSSNKPTQSAIVNKEVNAFHLDQLKACDGAGTVVE